MTAVPPAGLPSWLGLVAGAIMSVALAGAIWLIHTELAAHPLREIMNELSRFAPEQIWLALAAVCASYGALALYDHLALSYAGQSMPLAKTAFASATAYALSNSLGFGFLTSVAVRFRLYAAWGLDNARIAIVTAASGLAVLLGAMAIVGVGLLFETDAFYRYFGLPWIVSAPLGALLLQIILLLFLWSAVGKEDLLIRQWRIPRPRLAILAAQLALSVFDWCATAFVLYALLPDVHGLSFLAFLPIFVLSSSLGALSGLPGGIGVFEASMLVLLPGAESDAVAASLILYRILYYLLPVALAALMLSVRQAVRSRAGIAQAMALGSSLFNALAPLLFSVLIFAAGLLMLASSATPALPHRLALLNDMLPLGLIETSHFVASLVGILLLFVAWGLRRRLDGAYRLALLLLALAALAALLKGGDIEEAVLVAVLGGLLFLARSAFYRHGGLSAIQPTAGWALAIALGFGATFWLGLFAFRHVEYSNDLWWTFLVSGDAPRFLRAQAAIAVLGAVYAIWRFASAPPRLARPPAPEELEAAQAAISTAENAHADANLALLGDKSFLFSASGHSFIMYGVRGRNLIAMGEPVGRSAEFADLLWQFRDFADRTGAHPIFYSVRKEMLPGLIEIGLAAQKIGETALVPLESFSLEGPSRAKLRTAERKLVREGCSFEILPKASVASNLDELRRVSDAWLAIHQGAEKGFSLGNFTPAYLCRFDIAVVRRFGAIVAFANLWTTADKSELSIDLMRHAADSPNGVMDYLFIELALWGKARGYKVLDLGMAPLAGLEARRLAPFFTRVGSFIFEHGEALYGFEGLRGYKDKFDPLWEPLYIAAPNPFLLPVALGDIALLTSGGLMPMLRR